MAYPLIPRHDPVLATRGKRPLMGFMSYLMFVIPLLYAVEHGWMRFGYVGLAWFLVLAMLINVVFLMAIRSGFTRRFADPRVMVGQVAVARVFALGLA